MSEQSIACASPSGTRKDYYRAGGMFLLVFATYLLLRQFSWLPDLRVSESMSYGFVFGIGLVAAFSTCMAVTGGLLLAASAKYNEQFPAASAWQKFLPQLSFNVGRVASYTVFGGLVGAVGSVFSLSTTATGILTVVVSIVMIMLGLDLLKLFPALKKFYPRMPKFIGAKVYAVGRSNRPGTPFFLGAGTFFLPCGFTQALQLYVLSRGDWAAGALTMLVFSLGTLPALLSLSAVSSFARGSFQEHFLRFAGVVVVLLGIFNVKSGLALAGVNLYPTLDSTLQITDDPNVELIDGKQVVRMRVKGLRYEPAQIRVRAGVPVEWRINGSQAAGCAQILTMPAAGIEEYLPQSGEKVITFMPERAGRMAFTCGMGMTDGAFLVVEAGATAPKTACDSTIANCIEI